MGDVKLTEDTLLFADECAALASQVAGEEITVGAWRRAVSRPTQTNAAPAPVHYVRVNGRQRPQWLASAVIAWAQERPGRGYVTLERSHLPGYWNARECAEQAGISHMAWWMAVKYPTQHNPAPQPVDPQTVPEGHRRWSYWLPGPVRAWIAERPGRGNWQT